MKTAIWIIAICEVIRAAQNAIQLLVMRSEKGMRENAYHEFVTSLKMNDREFVKRMLEEFVEDEGCQST
jgi:hypothetical protein